MGEPHVHEHVIFIFFCKKTAEEMEARRAIDIPNAERYIKSNLKNRVYYKILIFLLQKYKENWNWWTRHGIRLYKLIRRIIIFLRIG